MTPTAGRRLSPEDRRNQILDVASSLILDQGLSTLTMERLASAAGVSNPLIYKYFDTRLQILQELLVREYRAHRESVTRSIAAANDYREAVRGYVDINFQQFAGGDVLSLLMGQADVRRAIEVQEKPRHGPLFVKEMAKEFNIPGGLAEKLVVMASAASIAAAEHYGRSGGDREAQIDQTVAFIFGGIERLLAAEAAD